VCSEVTGYQRRAWRPVAELTILLVILAGYVTVEPVVQAQDDRFHDVQASVVRVVDGDTIYVVTLDGAFERVRYAGSVDAPERCEPGGAEATGFNGSLTDGQVAILRIDSLNERDRYGRLLAYVFVGDRLVQRELLLSGMANNRYREIAMNPWQAEWDEWEQEAWSEHRGLWGAAWAAYSPENLPPRMTC
jgi:micrococcal nuclease